MKTTSASGPEGDRPEVDEQEVDEQEVDEIEELQFLAQRAGMELSSEELEELKPQYDLHMRHVQHLHSIDLGSEEIGMVFHPDWPAP